MLSVTVNTTVFGPTLEQSKSVTSIAIEAIPQASFDPLSTSAATIETFPVASKSISKS